MEDSVPNKRLLLGYGDIGQRLAKVSFSQGIPFSAVRRHPNPTDGIQVTPGDVTQPEVLTQCFLNLGSGPVDVVITLTPDDYSEQGYRDCYLACAQALVETLPTHHSQSRVIFVSSTSVYGQHSGEWVNEQSECLPKSATANVLLEAEAVISSIGVAFCNLRFSGIYGPGRTRIIARTKSGNIPPENPIHWTNRIHSNDCARVIDHLLRQTNDDLPPCLLATDSLPAPRHEVQMFIADQLGILASVEETSALNSGPTGKRCSNKLLLASGFEFDHPDYRSGFSALIKSEY